MSKKIFLSTLSAVAFTIGAATAAGDDSLVLLNTNKTIEDTKPKPLTKIEPAHNITDIMSTPSEKETDVYFTADEMQNDSEKNTITASGSVEIIRDDLTLRADKVIYNQTTDHISAEGNVVLLDETGNVMLADKVDLREHMKRADIDNIKVILRDKTRLAARSFHKKPDDTKVLRYAVYSPCDNCRGESPLWQIKAGKVMHNPVDQDIEYQNAFLELKGIPVFYTPYFSHPDPSVERRSGFLFPRFMSNNYLGAGLQPQYFWNISPHQNVIFNPIITSDKGIIYSAIYNQYFTRGELNASGTFMHDDDEDKNRGNLFLYGRYEINDYWVADTDINYASDDNYLKDLSLPKKDDSWLTSRVRLQAFDNRNYASVEGYYYDMLSYNLQDNNTPYILPLMSYENISAPASYGAYVKTTFNTASVYHEDDNTSHRATMINSWNLPYTSPYGEKYRLVASLKSASGVAGATLVTAMCGNGYEFGIKTSGTGERWFTAPAPTFSGRCFSPSDSLADAAPWLGDSSNVEAWGLGGMAAAASPALLRERSESPADGVRQCAEMAEICFGRSSVFAVPLIPEGFAPAGILPRLAVEKRITPKMHGGILSRVTGGQIGVGYARTPLECFEKALA